MERKVSEKTDEKIGNETRKRDDDGPCACSAFFPVSPHRPLRSLERKPRPGLDRNQRRRRKEKASQLASSRTPQTLLRSSHIPSIIIVPNIMDREPLPLHHSLVGSMNHLLLLPLLLLRRERRSGSGRLDGRGDGRDGGTIGASCLRGRMCIY